MKKTVAVMPSPIAITVEGPGGKDNADIKARLGTVVLK